MVAGGSHCIVHVLEADGAFQFFLECFDICLHLRMKLLFVSGFNDYGRVRLNNSGGHGGGEPGRLRYPPHYRNFDEGSSYYVQGGEKWMLKRS
jgi:hypothetical protein